MKSVLSIAVLFTGTSSLACAGNGPAYGESAEAVVHPADTHTVR